MLRINGLSQKTIELCRSKDILIIEDVCESHGVVLENGKKAGAEGIISCFSFYYAHHMSTIEGGMVCTNDENIYQHLRMLRGHGMLRESTDQQYKKNIESTNADLNPLFIFTTPGFNFRNNEIGQFGLSQLRRLDKMIELRNKNFEYFLENVPNWAFSDFKLQGQSNYAFNLILKEKNSDLMQRLENRLNDCGVEFRRGSAGGGNQLRQPYVKNWIGKQRHINPAKEAPVADHIHFFGMYIGNYPELELNDIDSLTSILKKV